MSIWEYIMEFLHKIMNILKTTKIPETPENTTSTTTPTDNTTNTNEDTIPLPLDDFTISYYMDQNHPITDANLKEFKKLGMTEVHFRADYGTTTAMKAVKNICDNNGFKLKAWVWSDYAISDAKILSDMGIGLHIDVETYNVPNYINYITQMFNATRNSSLEICIKPQGWDGDMRYDLIAPVCDYIVPMCYIGDYGQSVSTLAAFAKKYSELYPGKFKIALETYESDRNTTPKSASAIKAEIEAVKPYVDGIILFRYGLSNFNGGITTNTSNTTETTGTTNTSTCSDDALKNGCTGENVKTLQTWLNNNGFGTLVVDGIFGTVTETKVKTFQSTVGLTADGWVGPATRAKMATYYTNTDTVKGTAWQQFEQACGTTFNNFTEIYNWILKNTDYSYYLDDQYTWQQELDEKLNYLNCVDMCQALSKIARSGGYTTVHYGVYCPSYQVSHAIFTIQGKEFTSPTWIDGAAAASDNYQIGSHWCDGSITKEPGWIPYE